MRSWQEWLIEALKDKSLPYIDGDELAMRSAVRTFVDLHLRGRDSDYRLFSERIARLEQFHCEHEFSSHDKGCLASIFCSKCGALHPDWERDYACDSSPGRMYVFKCPENMAVVDGRAYRKKKKKGKKK